jgi:hypothetical protein
MRNSAGRLRIDGIRVKLAPALGADDGSGLERCLEIFEDYCVVTESVREGIAVTVDVDPSYGDGEAI